MIDGEEQEILLNTLAETPQEEVHTIEEDIYVIGVESLNGQAGDLTLKSINGENLVGEGNIALQTPLNQAQLSAVNSGIDSAKVGQIATNASNITTLQNTKQDNLTQAQLNAVNSGIDATKVTQIATNTGNITSATNRVTTIEGKIPSAASSSNKLTDKNYVDNAIATNTANYISDNGQPFQSYADLVAYSGPLTNNDYAFVETIDQAGNDIYTRYKYNADQNLWAEEYTITNPYFTSDQWASINSGIAANDVAQIGTNKTDIATLQTSKQDKLTTAQQAAVDSGIDATKVQQIATNATDIATLQTGKQDKLTAGTNIQINGTTISATDTTYTAGTGLTLNGTQFSVTEPVPSGFFTDTTTSQTSEGTDLTINGTTESPLKNVELKGDTFQQTYSGKNLIPPTGIHNGAFVYYSQLENDNYTETSNTKYRAIKIENLPAGTYTFSINWNYTAYIIRYATGGEVIQLSRNGNTFTLTTATSGLFGINFRTSTSAEFTDDEYTVQLEAGSTATDYEKFVGGIASPNPDYPQDIQVVTGEQTVKVTGKNLLPSTADWEQTLNGVTVKYENGVYTFSGTSTANGSTTVHSSVAPYTIQTGDYFHYCNSFVSGNINIQIFFTDGTNFATSMNSANRIIPIYNYNGTSYVGRTISSYRVNFSGGNTFNGTAKPMILHNISTATAYEPYQGQSYEVNLGKNLLNLEAIATTGVVVSNGVATGTARSFSAAYGVSSGVPVTFNAKQVAVSLKAYTDAETAGTNNGLKIRAIYKDGTGADIIAFTNDITTATYKTAVTSGAREIDKIAITYGNLPDNTWHITDFQIEAGDQATSYAPYFTPIELCGIGKKPDGTYTYQDNIWKDGADWKKHKAVGKVVYDGTQDFSASNANNMYFRNDDTFARTANNDTVGALASNNFTATTYNNTLYANVDYGVAVASGANRIAIRNKDCADKTAFLAWLSTHNTTVYYALATPTDTTITDETLIAQLEALWNATSYNPQTNIINATPAPNLPAILTIDTFKNNWAGTLAGYQETINRLEARVEELEA